MHCEDYVIYLGDVQISIFSYHRYHGISSIFLVYQIMMHWVPDVCIGGTLDSLMTKPVTATTEGNRFTVFDLRFDCRYIIQVGVIGTVDEASSCLIYSTINIRIC